MFLYFTQVIGELKSKPVLCSEVACIATVPVGPGCVLMKREYPNGKGCDGDYFCEYCVVNRQKRWKRCTKKRCSDAGLLPVGDSCRNILRHYPNGKACDK